MEVKIDESKFGKCKYYRGHRVEGQWVFGGHEKYNKRKVFMNPVKDRKQNTLIPLIQKWIHPDNIIHSDCWKSYNKLAKLGYTHVTVNHSKEIRKMKLAQMELKVIGGMLKSLCHVMVFTEACTVDIWQNSCGEESTWMMTNSCNLLQTLIQHLNINTYSTLLLFLRHFVAAVCMC